MSENRVMLLRGDCHELLRLVPSGRVDMVLSDWPYGGTDNKWDKRLDLDRVWPEIWRVVKPDGAVVLFAASPFDKIVAAPHLDLLRYEYVWVKPQGTNFLDVRRMPFKRTEYVLVFCRKLPPYYPVMEPGKPYIVTKRKPTVAVNQTQTRSPVTVNDGFRWPTNVLEYGHDRRAGGDRDRGLHPTQKPVALCARLIRTHSQPGELILDNCAGSGSIAVAALRTGRRFLGFELDPGHHATAAGRIAAELEERSHDNQS